MEYASGGELFDYIVKRKRLQEDEACRFFQQIISGVEYIHKVKICHRDLKLENWVLESGKDVWSPLKLIDFGLSTHFTQGHRLSRVVGSSYYVAPEVLKKSYTEACDLWSLGVIVFVLLQGYLPFELTEKFSTNKYELHFDPVDFRHISLQAKTLISSCLDISPHKRPSAKDLLLAPWLQESTHEGRQESRVPLNSLKKIG